MRGKIFFFSGPSGVGKGTLINMLRERHPEWIFPPSCTTRDPRPGEVDGETYYFISHEDFRGKIADGEFLEYAEVHGGNYYGTLREKLLSPLESGKTVIREFDVQGFSAAKERLERDDYVGIFLRPAEGTEELVKRIKARAPISDDELARRIESMEREYALSHLYDETIVSHDGDHDRLIADAEAIIAKHLNV